MPKQEDEQGRFQIDRTRFARHGEPTPPIPLPPELAEFLKDREYACVPEATNLGTVYVIKAPAREIDSVRGRVPIAVRHELYEHAAAPVVRTVLTIYDQPQTPLALETFTNVADPTQRAEFAALADQKLLYLLCYDELLRHRLNKVVPNDNRDAIPKIVATAQLLLDRIPEGQRDFDRAKAEVMVKKTL